MGVGWCGKIHLAPRGGNPRLGYVYASHTKAWACTGEAPDLQDEHSFTMDTKPQTEQVLHAVKACPPASTAWPALSSASRLPGAPADSPRIAPKAPRRMSHSDGKRNARSANAPDRFLRRASATVAAPPILAVLETWGGLLIKSHLAFAATPGRGWREPDFAVVWLARPLICAQLGAWRRFVIFAVLF